MVSCLPGLDPAVGWNLSSAYPMHSSCDIAILGPGKVGGALARRAWRAGWPIRAVAGGREPNAAQALAGNVHADAVSLEQAAAAATLVFLTVRDDAIEPLCRQLADSGALDAHPFVVHCSGALDSRILAPAAARGCGVASAHPLQTFPSAEEAMQRLDGVYWFIEGDGEGLEILRQLIEDIGGHPTVIDADAKCRYHAAAVMGCNYLSALLDACFALAMEAGIESDLARKAFAPLLETTLENILARGPAQALSGPIARGDAGVLDRHLQDLDALGGDYGLLYRVLGRRTVDLALRKGSIDQQAARWLLERLEREA